MNFKSLSLLAAAGLCTLSLCGSVSAAELRVATNPTLKVVQNRHDTQVKMTF